MIERNIMGLLGALVKTVCLPLSVAADVIEAPGDIIEGEAPGSNTAENLIDIVKEVKEEFD
jgi:hypothetical protein